MLSVVFSYTLCSAVGVYSDKFKSGKGVLGKHNQYKGFPHQSGMGWRFTQAPLPVSAWQLKVWFRSMAEEQSHVRNQGGDTSGDSLKWELKSVCVTDPQKFTTATGTWALNCENQMLNRLKLLLHLAQLFSSNASFIQKAVWKSHLAFVHWEVQILSVTL